VAYKEHAQSSDLERARAIAVALEQENAELRHRLGEEPGSDDVVGQEGFPLGDPWEPS